MARRQEDTICYPQNAHSWEQVKSQQKLGTQVVTLTGRRSPRAQEASLLTDQGAETQRVKSLLATSGRDRCWVCFQGALWTPVLNVCERRL